MKAKRLFELLDNYKDRYLDKTAMEIDCIFENLTVEETKEVVNTILDRKENLGDSNVSIESDARKVLLEQLLKNHCKTKDLVGWLKTHYTKEQRFLDIYRAVYMRDLLEERITSPIRRLFLAKDLIELSLERYIFIEGDEIVLREEHTTFNKDRELYEVRFNVKEKTVRYSDPDVDSPIRVLTRSWETDLWFIESDRDDLYHSTSLLGRHFLKLFNTLNNSKIKVRPSYLDDAIRIVKMLFDHPNLECLLNIGLKNRTLDSIIGTYNQAGCSSILNVTETKPNKILGLSKSLMKVLREESMGLYDIGMTSKIESLVDTNLTKQLMLKTREEDYSIIHYVIRTLELLQGSDKRTLLGVADYFIKTPLDHWDMYFDYISMRDQLQPNDYPTQPNNLRARHDELVDRINELEDEGTPKQNDKIELIAKANKALEWTYKEYRVELPKRVIDIRKEGRDLDHCVGGYIDRVVEGDCIIVFLRHKGKPCITIELRGDRIIQALGYDNRDPNEEEEEVLRLWAGRKGLLRYVI